MKGFHLTLRKPASFSRPILATLVLGLAGSAPFLITPPYSAITDITKVTLLPVPNGGSGNRDAGSE